MRRVTQYLLLGVTCLVGACSEGSVTAPQDGAAALPAAVMGAKGTPAPTASCTWSPSGTGTYDLVVQWSALSVTYVEIDDGNGSPTYEVLLNHPTRKGSVSATVNAQPATATLTGRSIGIKQQCQGS